MPICIPDDLPARDTLAHEGIFAIPAGRASHQDIRPLRVALLNLMPTKVVTETQFARVLSNSPLQVELTLLTTETYKPKNTSEEHLGTFYKTISDVRDEKFDGLIVTGAPVEHMPFTDVAYWTELTEIFDWSLTNVWSSMFVCWGAQAALQHFHDVPKRELSEKLFGVYPQKIIKPDSQLFRGFDDYFNAPVSRHTEVRRTDIEPVADLEILAESSESGLHLVRNTNRRQFFIFNHPEYDAETLQTEYERDRAEEKDIVVPVNYFPADDPANDPLISWRAHGQLLYNNWLNYYVYQETPYELQKIDRNTPPCNEMRA